MPTKRSQWRPCHRPGTAVPCDTDVSGTGGQSPPGSVDQSYCSLYLRTILRAITFRISVTTNSIMPRAKAARVLALSNSWSPVSRVTICTVTVVTESSGLAVRLAARPAAITTIMVSPMAREAASRMPPIMPGRAAGKITFFMVSDWVAPSAREPSRRVWGTALITSSDNDETNGIIMTPITRPAASALWDEASRPILSARSRMNGATVRAAKKPYTTVGTPASISSSGLITARAGLVAYSDRYTADSKPTGTATSSAMAEISKVPVNSGIIPKAPSEPTWSARRAVWGLQDVPNRNSVMGTLPKNRKVSKITEKTIPTVVRTATAAQTKKIHRKVRSTFSRALMWGCTRVQA